MEDQTLSCNYSYYPAVISYRSDPRIARSVTSPHSAIFLSLTDHVCKSRNTAPAPKVSHPSDSPSQSADQLDKRTPRPTRNVYISRKAEVLSIKPQKMAPSKKKAGHVDRLRRFEQVQRLWNAIQGPAGVDVTTTATRQQELIAKMSVGDTLETIKQLAPLAEDDDADDYPKKWVETAASFSTTWTYVTKWAEELGKAAQLEKSAKLKKVEVKEVNEATLTDDAAKEEEAADQVIVSKGVSGIEPRDGMLVKHSVHVIR